MTDINQEPSEEEQKRLKHLSRPTKSSMAKREPVEMKRMHMPSVMDMDRQSWKTMQYYQDTHKCLWTKNGTVKKGSKI